jgi:hypothetical protein
MESFIKLSQVVKLKEKSKVFYDEKNIIELDDTNAVVYPLSGGTEITFKVPKNVTNIQTNPNRNYISFIEENTLVIFNY